MDCCDVLETLTTEDLFLKEYKYWKLYLRSRVKTLGTSALITKEHYSAMSEIPQDAFTELSEISKEIEKVYNELFQPDKYNYQMNMMVETHTHFNIFPRYEKTIEYEGQKWEDTGWPKLVGENLNIDDALLERVAQNIKNKLSINDASSR